MISLDIHGLNRMKGIYDNLTKLCCVCILPLISVSVTSTLCLCKPMKRGEDGFSGYSHHLALTRALTLDSLVQLL